MTDWRDGHEALPTTDTVDAESEGQYPTSLNHIVRKLLYNVYAEPPIGQLEGRDEFFGIDGEIIKALELTGDETLVDVGCGDGGFIQLLAEVCGHRGKLIGVNNDEAHYLNSQVDLADKPNVTFIEEDARSLSFEDESADVVTLKFLLYHLDSPELALDEALRILKPGGKLLIATRDPGNQARMWQFMCSITDELKRMTMAQETDELQSLPNGDKAGKIDYSTTQPPETFYSRYDMKITESEIAKKGLVVASKFMQSSRLGNSNLLLPSGTKNTQEQSAWEMYELALLSLTTSFRGAIPTSVDMKKAIDKRVKPIFEEDTQNGFFVEQVEQGFILATKPTK